MTDNINITQKAGLGSENNNIIGQQTVNNYNYYDMKPEQVQQLAMEIFQDNFPKLQKIAEETAKKRAEELIKEFLKKLPQENIGDLSLFADPDMQCMLWESQRDYARSGDENLLDMLSSLIVSRVKYDKNQYMKIIINRAEQVAKYLTAQHLDYLSVLFILKHVKFDIINSLEELEKKLKYMASIFNPIQSSSISLLISLGCLEININSATDILAKTYKLDKNEVKKIFPDKFAELDESDYGGVSHVGIILAIVNAERKCPRYKLNPEIWIK